MPPSPYTRLTDSGQPTKKHRKPHAKIGRPKIRRYPDSYKPRLGQKIATEVANGKSLAQIAKENPDWCPVQTTIRAWYKNHPDFAKLLDQAYVDRADFYVEKMFDVMEKLEKGLLKPATAKILLDEYFRIATKLHPKFLEPKLANLQITPGDGLKFSITLAPDTDVKQIENIVDVQEKEEGVWEKPDDV